MRFAAPVGMKTTIISLSIALALGTLAGCDRNNATPKQSGATPSPSSTAPSTPATPSTPAGSGSSAQPSTKDAVTGTPSPDGKNSASQPPVQGREDVRQPEQRRDFQHKGDGAGPKPGGG